MYHDAGSDECFQIIVGDVSYSCVVLIMLKSSLQLKSSGERNKGEGQLLLSVLIKFLKMRMLHSAWGIRLGAQKVSEKLTY